MSPPERRAPTHVLTVTIPLNLRNGKGDFDPIQDAVMTVLSLSRAMYVGSICDSPSLTLDEVAGE